MWVPNQSLCATASHCTKQRGASHFWRGSWADQQGGSQASEEEVLPARRGGKALLSAALGLQKRRHPKDVEEAIVLWMRGRFGALGGSMSLQISENGGCWGFRQALNGWLRL